MCNQKTREEKKVLTTEGLKRSILLATRESKKMHTKHGGNQVQSHKEEKRRPDRRHPPESGGKGNKLRTIRVHHRGEENGLRGEKNELTVFSSLWKGAAHWSTQPS